MKYIFIILMFGSMSSMSQTIDVFEYIGPPYHHKPLFVFTDTPNVQLDFILCAMNVPDSLIIKFCDTTLIFYVGAGIQEPGQLLGFIEMEYKDGVLTTLQDSANIPSEFEQNGSTCWRAGGAMLLHFYLPKGCCSLNWTVIGNRHAHTIYSFKVVKIESGFWEVSDTLVDYSCTEPSSGRFVIDRNNCIAYWQEIINAEVDDEPDVKNPDCDTTGYIHFPNFPQFNLENLSEGIYEVTIHNSICEKTFTITLHDRKVCKVYVPNIFSPNDDGINDYFDVSNDKGSQYKIWIYSRWGELIHEGIYDNNSGWNGYFKGEKVQSGVYVYKIQILDDLDENYIVGDVTVI